VFGFYREKSHSSQSIVGQRGWGGDSQDLEVETILKKVKAELLLDEGVSEFGERLKEREQLKQAAQTTRAARIARLQQLCYPQLTCEWFVEGLDYCWTNWHHQFKRPLTPPPAPPPSPDVSRKRLPLHLPLHQMPNNIPTKRRRR